MNNYLIWIYIVFLLIGGFIGFLKAQSKASLVSSLIFSILLAIGQLGLVKLPYWTPGLLVLLIIVFAIRLAKTKKFMPAGLLTILTILTLGLSFVR